MPWKSFRCLLVAFSMPLSTAAFTLDTYAHVTEKMRQESARRMDSFIEGIQAAKKA